MHVRPFHWRLIWSVLTCLFSTAAANGQQKYPLQGNPAPGDLSIVDGSAETTATVTVNVAGSGQGDQQFPYSVRERVSFREKVLAVDPKGPAAVRRTYTIARVVSTDAYLNEHKKALSLQGKTVTIRREGDHVTVTPQSGQITPEDRNSLLDELDHSDLDLLPDHDVAPGDEWTPDPHRILVHFPGMDQAEARYQFQQVVPYAGHSCALIKITAELRGKPAGMPAPVTMKLAGSLYQALDLKRPLAIHLSGPMTVEGERAANGVTTRFSGHGTLEMQQTRRWLTVNGHPVAAGRG